MRILTGTKRAYASPGCLNRDALIRYSSKKPRFPRHATVAAQTVTLPGGSGPSTIRSGDAGEVSLAREQRRLAAIVAADVVGHSHAAYEQIYYSSLVPRTYLCARLLETPD